MGGAKRQALDVLEAVEHLPYALEVTVTRVIEVADAAIYVAIAVGLLLILAEIDYGLGIVVKESGHIGYESAKLVDGFVDGFLRFFHHITSFFHIHWHPPYIDLEDHLIEFKSSNPKYICSELASYWAMLTVFPRMSWSHHVCPVMRYFYGTPIDVILTPLIGWASYDWAPEGNNCRKPPNLDICIFCNFYFFLRIVAFAIIAVFIVAPTWPLISNIIDIAYHVVLLVIDVFFDICHWAARAVHGIENIKKKL